MIPANLAYLMVPIGSVSQASRPASDCKPAGNILVSTTADRPIHRRVLALTRSGIGWLERVPVALSVLLLRLGVALVFWRSGLTKLPLGNDMTILLFEEEYRVPILSPAVAAYLTTAIELVVPWMLVIGIGTRVGAAILLAETLVIQIFVYPENYPDHLLWAGPLLYLLLRGPGKWSVDHYFRRNLIEAGAP